MSPDPQGTAPEGVSGPPAAPAGSSVTVMPVTGEVLDLRESPTDQLAEWRVRALELERELNALKSDLDREVVRRMDYEGLKSAEIGGFTLTIPPSTEISYDAPRLSVLLEALVQDGRIARGVAERVIKKELRVTASVQQADKLLRHADPEVRQTVASCRSETERPHRRVTVRRAHDKYEEAPNAIYA